MRGGDYVAVSRLVQVVCGRRRLPNGMVSGFARLREWQGSANWKRPQERPAVGAAVLVKQQLPAGSPRF